MVNYKFEWWHVIIIMVALAFIGKSELFSIVDTPQSFSWSYECIDIERNCVDDVCNPICAIDSPNRVNSGEYFSFKTSEPYFEESCKYQYPDTETIPAQTSLILREGETTPTEEVTTEAIINDNHWTTSNTPLDCWYVVAKYNNEEKEMKIGDEWVINDNFKITFENVEAGIRGGQLWDAWNVNYGFYLDMTQISAQFEDPSPLVDFITQHNEDVLITNKIHNFDGGFLVTKEQATFFQSMEGWDEKSNDGIPFGISTAPLIFMTWDLGDNQYSVIPYIHFTSEKITEGEKITTLDKYLMSLDSAEKTTRTLVGNEDYENLITIQRNEWMQQFPDLMYEGVSVKELSIQTPKEASFPVSYSLFIILGILITLGVAYTIMRKRK